MLVRSFLVLAMIVINGGLHLDGIADTFDAIASRAGRDKKLAIMKDSTGRRLTTGLFEEFGGTFAKLSDWKKQYLKIADYTEYETCHQLLGDWEHWQILRQSKLLASHMDTWRRAVEVSMRSSAIRRMVTHSKGGAGAVTAARYLADAGFLLEQRTKKEDKEIKREASTRARQDAERLGLTVINGGS